MQLVAEQYRINQQTTIAKAKQLKLAAEEKAAAQELLETTVLLEAAKGGNDFTSLDPETAISIARAAWDTLLVEEHLAVSRVQECEVILTSLQDAVDEVCARLEDANLQVGRLLNIINENRIHISTSIKIATPLDPQTMFTSPFKFPNSPCAILSSYSKSMDFSGDDLGSDDFGSEGVISQ